MELLGPVISHFVGEMYTAGASLLSGKLGENYLGAIPDTLLNDNPGELCVARMLVKK